MMVVNLEMKCAFFRHELHAMREEVVEVRAENDAMRADMADMRAGEVRLMVENDAMKAEMAEVRAENDEMR